MFVSTVYIWYFHVCVCLDVRVLCLFSCVCVWCDAIFWESLCYCGMCARIAVGVVWLVRYKLGVLCFVSYFWGGGGRESASSYYYYLLCRVFIIIFWVGSLFKLCAGLPNTSHAVRMRILSMCMYVYIILNNNTLVFHSVGV